MNKIKKLVSVLLIISVLGGAPTQAHAGWLSDGLKVVGVVAVGLALGPATLGVGLIGAGLIVGGMYVDEQEEAAQQQAQQQAQECVSKSIDQLKEELRLKDARLRVHRTDAYYEQKANEGKEGLCEAIMNSEGEESNSPSETFLWKPKSDSDGKAVTLLPSSLSGRVYRTDLLDAGNIKIETGRFSGDTHNGMRPHYRFSKPGSSYGSGIQVVGIVPEGAYIWKIPNGGSRFESGMGRFVTNAEMAAWEAEHAAKDALANIPNIDDLFDKNAFCPAFAEGTGPKNLRIMLMGDSNTAGTGNPAGAVSPNGIGYRKFLKDKLVTNGFNVDFVGSQCDASSLMSDCEHEGYPGKGIAQLQARVNAGTLEQYNPNVVVVMVGSNDMWVSLDNRTAISNAQATAKVAELKTLLKDINEKAPGAAVIVAKPATPSNASNPLTIYRQGIDTIASENMFIEIVDFSGFSNDGVHYRPAGFEQIATAITNKIITGVNACIEALGIVENTFTEDEFDNLGSNDELSAQCRLSDSTVEVDEDITITADVDGGMSPYKIKWSGETSYIDDFDKTDTNQTVTFERAGEYTLKLKVTDDDGEKASDTCSTIKVTEGGSNDDDDDVVVKVDNNNMNNTQNNSTTSNYSFYRDLTMGSRGEDVVALQNFLISTGYLVMPAGVDKGYFGELTKTALGNWQAARGITPSAGYFGPKTRAAIIGNDVVQNSTTIQQSTHISPMSNSAIEQYYQSINTPDAENTCVSLSSTIYFGEENNNVGRVQQFLVNGGYLVMPAGASYGYYGRTTVTALSKFMANKGVTHNGAIMDAKVLDQIRNASCMVN